MMAPIERPLFTAKSPHLKREKISKSDCQNTLKDLSCDDRHLDGSVQIRIKKEDEEEEHTEITSYPAMNEDEGVVIKREDSEDSEGSDSSGDSLEEEEEEEDDEEGLDGCSISSRKNDTSIKNGESNSENADDPMSSLLCKICGKQFFRAFYFNAHIKTHETASQVNQPYDKPHKCQECGKSFALLQHLAGHSRTHIVERYFECPVCRRKFTERSNLTMHLLKTHPDEKPYKCSECDKQFTQSSALKKHLRSHSSITSQEDIDRIDMLFFIEDAADRDSDEPLKKKIKIEREDEKILPPKEKSVGIKQKDPSVKEEKPNLKDKVPVKGKSSSQKDKLMTLSVKSPDKLLKEKTSLDSDTSVVDKSQHTSEINREDEILENLPAPCPPGLSDDPSSVAVKSEPISDESSCDSHSFSIASLENETHPSPYAIHDNHELKCSIVKDDVPDETVNSIEDTPPLRSVKPLDLVKNPLIKIAKFTKTAQKNELLMSKYQSIPNISHGLMLSNDENNLESIDGNEEMENSHPINLSSGEKSVKGKSSALVSYCRNKAELFSSSNKNKSDNRDPVPSTERPEGDYDVKFKCHRCDIFLESSEELHDHLMDHTGVSLCECRFCGKDFSNMDYLKKHLFLHVMGSIPQDCTRCGRSYCSFRELKEHCISKKCENSSSGKFKCFRCRKQTSSLKKLKIHLLSQCNEEPVQYYFPKKSISSKTENADNTDTVSAKCGEEGDNVGESGQRTTDHGTSNENQWITQKFENPDGTNLSDIKDLNMTESDAEALRVLMEADPSNKSRPNWTLQCQGCGHRFDNSEKAKLHCKLGCVSEPNTNPTAGKDVRIKVIFEEDEHQQCYLHCSECGAKVAGVEKMLLHIKEHIYEQNVLDCPVLKCGKQFRDPKDFKLHLKAHTGHKPYKCGDCGKRFFLRENYENHAQRHGILKSWSSLNTFMGEKIANVVSARSPITIESSITNLEVSEAEPEKKSPSTSQQTSEPIPARSELKKKKDVMASQANISSSKSSLSGGKTYSSGSRTKFSGSRPNPLGSRPNPLGSRPNPLGSRPNPLGSRPNPLGSRPFASGSRPVVSGSRPIVSGSRPFNAARPSILNKASPPMNTALDGADKLSESLGDPMPSFSKPSPPAIKPAPTILKAPTILSRPASVINGPPSVINRPPPIFNRFGHSSGGSLSVTPQGIFTVGPPRFAASISVDTKPAYSLTVSKPSLSPSDSNIRLNPSSFYCISEESKAQIDAANAELKRFPRSGRCEVCKKTCSRLDKHMMVHLNQKPHLCPVCPQAFRQSEHLRRHIRARHEGNHRQFECPQCRKKLTRKDKLKEHMKNCGKSNIFRALPVGFLGNALFEMIPGPHDSPLQGHTTA